MARSFAEGRAGTLLNELFAVAENPDQSLPDFPFQETSLKTRIGILSPTNQYIYPPPITRMLLQVLCHGEQPFPSSPS